MANTAGTMGTTGDPVARFSDEELAYHEAGHAVMHALNGGMVERVSIERGDPQRGVRVQPLAEAGMSEPEARRRIAALVAGEVALFLRSGERRQVPDSVDREGAMRAARAAGVSDAAANAMITEEWERVRDRLRDADADAPGVPDAVLAVRAAQGDREAFAGLMVRHGGEVQRLCRRLVGNSPLADDCAQDAWLLALLRLHRLRAPEHVGAWLRGIAIRVCRRALRRSSAQPRLVSLDRVDLELAGEPGPEESAVAAAELARGLRRAVGELPAGQREAVRLFYLQDLTYEAAADALGIATGALKVRLHKARAALRHRFRLADGATGSATGGAAPRAEGARRHAMAVHEAGHAVVHWLHGGTVWRISIAPVSGVEIADRAGGDRGAWGSGPALPVRDALQVLMGGEAATLVRGSRVPAAWSASDRATAASLAHRLTGGDAVEAALLVEAAWAAARDRLAEGRAWERVQRVAGGLVARQRLDGDEFRRLVAG